MELVGWMSITEVKIRKQILFIILGGDISDAGCQKNIPDTTPKNVVGLLHTG
jgi:hypothetical protein